MSQLQTYHRALVDAKGENEHTDALRAHLAGARWMFAAVFGKSEGYRLDEAAEEKAGFYHIRFGGSLTDRIDAHANLIKPGGIFLPAGTALSESYDNRTGQYGDAVAPIGCIASYEVL
ncbi:MAG: hypothetical protein ABSH03_19280 [Candidatus Lustribacter sp.]